MTEAKPKRRWLRFSLRTFLLAVTVLCIWLGLKVIAAQRQKEALRLLRNNGGSVLFEDEFVPTSGGSLVQTNRSPPGPGWLRNLLGDEYFRNVYRMHIGGEKTLTESEFRQIVTLPGVRSLNLGHVLIVPNDSHMMRPLKDSDLAVFENLHQLRELQLNSYGITSEGLKHFQNLTNLELLGLFQTDVGDFGLQYLKGLENLKNLQVKGSFISLQGLRELQKSLPNCKIYGP